MAGGEAAKAADTDGIDGLEDKAGAFAGGIAVARRNTSSRHAARRAARAPRVLPAAECRFADDTIFCVTAVTALAPPLSRPSSVRLQTPDEAQEGSRAKAAGIGPRLAGMARATQAARPGLPPRTRKSPYASARKIMTAWRRMSVSFAECVATAEVCRSENPCTAVRTGYWPPIHLARVITPNALSSPGALPGQSWIERRAGWQQMSP